MIPNFHLQSLSNFGDDSLPLQNLNPFMFNNSPLVENPFSFNPENQQSEAAKEESTKEKEKNKGNSDPQQDQPAIEEQKQTTVEFYQIYEIYSYLQQLIFVSSTDPILNVFTTFFSGHKEDPSHDRNEQNLKEQHQPKLEDFFIKRPSELPSNSWLSKLREKNRVCESKFLYYYNLAKKGQEEGQSQKNEKMHAESKVFESVWDIIHHRLPHLSEREMKIFIKLRDTVERTKGKLEIVEKLNDAKKFEEKNGKRSVCKICWQTFDHGKMLGGHVAKKHPGFSKLYKVRQYLCKIKNEEKKRRLYFKQIKKMKGELADSLSRDEMEQGEMENFLQENDDFF